MRAALMVLLLAPALAGCSIPLGDKPDCGEAQSERYDPTSEEPNVRTENGFTERIYGYSSDFTACIDQHARYDVRVEVGPGSTATCSDDPLSVVLQQQAGFFGSTVPALDPQAGPGGAGNYVYAHSGEIGLRQFSEPQYIFVTAAIGMPSTGDATADAACLAERIVIVQINARYMLPNEDDAGAAGA